MTENPPITGLARLMLRVASVALAAMMLVVVADVVLRVFFSTPVRGAYDLVEIGLLLMVFFGISGVIARQGEILIDLIDGLVGPRGVRILQAAASVFTFVLLLFLGWAMIGPGLDAWKWGGYSLELGMPNWVKWAMAFAGLAGVLWISALRMMRAFGPDQGAGTAGPSGSASEELR